MEPAASGPDGATHPQWVELVRLEAGDGLAEALHRFSAHAKVLLGAASVSVTAIVGTEMVTGGASDALSYDLDQHQYDAGQGPCLSALHEQRVITIDDLRDEGRWPAFDPAALEAGVLSMVCLPLDASGRYVGAINVYGGEVGAFRDPGLEPHFTALAEHAGVLLDNAGLYAEASAQAEQLKAAMDSRGVIEQAKGILIARERVTPDVAWDYLVRMSQRSHRKLRDIAQDVVLRATTGTLG